MKAVINKPQTVEEYFNSLPNEVAVVLKTVRKTLKQHLPDDAIEIISYGIPAFKWNKTPLYYAGWKEHVSIYPIPKGNADFVKKIKPYIAGKGTLKFKLSDPLPLDVVALVAKIRVAVDGIEYTASKKSDAKQKTRSAK